MRRYGLSALYLGLVVSAFVLGFLLWVKQNTDPFVYASVSDAPTSTVAMVLGASVYQNGTLSPVLAARADSAIGLYQSGKVLKIIVTGDNSEISHNEVNPVGNYLLAHGIPKSDIFLDHAGFDTYSSMYRARDVFLIKDMIIVSQSFHLARAVYIARSLGINASGVRAGGESFPYNTLREVPATLKAYADILINRTPKYLGVKYPVLGDGTPTWADATTTATSSLRLQVE
jgi:SanA protein